MVQLMLRSNTTLPTICNITVVNIVILLFEHEVIKTLTMGHNNV